MQLRKDIRLDLVFSFIFSLMLLLKPAFTADPHILLIWQNAAAVFVLCLWLRALSRKYPSVFLIKDYPASKNSPFKSAYVLFWGIIQGKLALFILLYCLTVLIRPSPGESFSLIGLVPEIFRILLLGTYALFILIIGASYFRLTPSGYWITLLAVAPFLLTSMLNQASKSVLVYASIIPPNFTLLFLYPFETPKTIIVTGLFAITLGLMILFTIKGIKKMLTGTKFLKLDITRMN